MTDETMKGTHEVHALAYTLSFVGDCGHRRQRGPYDPSERKLLPCATPGCPEGFSGGNRFVVRIAHIPDFRDSFRHQEPVVSAGPSYEEYVYNRATAATKNIATGEVLEECYLWRSEHDK